MRNISTRFSSGQTIIEVLIATVVVAVVMTAIAATLTSSLRNTTESRFRSFASTYAQEAMEIFIRERTILGWQQFSEVVAGGVFCLNTLPVNTTEFTAMTTGECTSGTPLSGTEFVREADVVVVSADEVEITISVEWVDNGRDRSLEVAQVFRNRN